MATYYLVRHGTTAWVDEDRLHGITDVPLNDNGIRQAQNAAEALRGVKARYLISSPLQRALQTAQAIEKTTGLTATPIQGLTEINFGWMEGKKIPDDLKKNHAPIIYMVNHRWLDFIRTISGDSRKKFRERAEGTFEEIRQQYGNENAIVVAHSGILDVILTRYFGDPNQGNYYALYPGSITEIEINESGTARLVRFNDHAHLKEWYPDGN